jgi:hypothetical protein
MKLESLADGSPGCPLLRLYDFTPGEAARLREAVAALASGIAERVELHDLPWVEPAGGCRLAVARRTWDQAIVRRAEPATFECAFTADTWANIAGLIEPFADGDATGFQWLADVPGEAALLLSVTGRW